MEINKNKIFIVIPVYNETLLLADLVRNLLQRGYTSIVVIDDGSTTTIEEAISHLPIVYIKHRINLGQGAALQTGFEYVQKRDFDAVITFDGDGQHDADDIDKLLPFIFDNSADVVMGSRFLEASGNQVPVVRRVVLQTARFINFIFSGLLLSDAHNGLRALNKKAVLVIQFSENRMAHASEILFQIKRHQLKIKEVPVDIRYFGNPSRKGQASIESIRILFDLVLHKLFE